MEHSTAKSTPAIAIVRVSSTKQGLQGDSPEDQLRAIESLLPLRNDEIVEIFEWIESASEMTDQQPAWKAIEFCKKHPGIQRAYVKCLDRFTRGGADAYIELTKALSALGVFVIDVYGIASDKQTNTMEHLGKKYKWSVFRPSYKAELLEAEKAKDEFRDIMTRLTTGSVNRVREGYAVGSPGYGYVNQRIENENGRKVYILVSHPEEAQYIRRMFELKAEGKTEVEIVEAINGMGFLTRTRYRRKKEGLRIVKAGKIGNVPLSKKQLENFLKNPIYCGVSTHSHLAYIEEKESSEKVEHFTPIVIKGEPLVSVDLWNRANHGKRMIVVKDDGTAQIFKGKSLERYTKKSKRNKAYPYKEYLACHICHRVLKASAPRSKSGKHVPTYHCSTKHKYWGTNGVQLHKDIERFIHHVEFSDEFREQFRTIMLEEWEKRRDTANQDSINYEKEVLRIKEEQRSILDTMKMVTLASMRQAYEQQYEELEKKKTAAMGRRDTKEVEEINIQTVISYCNYFMEHLDELLLDKEKPLESARLFSLCFDEAPTVFEILDGTPKLSPLFKLNEAYKKDKNILSESGGNRTHDILLKREAL